MKIIYNTHTKSYIKKKNNNKSSVNQTPHQLTSENKNYLKSLGFKVLSKNKFIKNQKIKNKSKSKQNNSNKLFSIIIYIHLKLCTSFCKCSNYIYCVKKENE